MKALLCRRDIGMTTFQFFEFACVYITFLLPNYTYVFSSLPFLFVQLDEFMVEFWGVLFSKNVKRFNFKIFMSGVLFTFTLFKFQRNLASVFRITLEATLLQIEWNLWNNEILHWQLTITKINQFEVVLKFSVLTSQDKQRPPV